MLWACVFRGDCERSEKRIRECVGLVLVVCDLVGADVNIIDCVIGGGMPFSVIDVMLRGID